MRFESRYVVVQCFLKSLNSLELLLDNDLRMNEASLVRVLRPVRWQRMPLGVADQPR